MRAACLWLQATWPGVPAVLTYDSTSAGRAASGDFTWARERPLLAMMSNVLASRSAASEIVVAGMGRALFSVPNILIALVAGSRFSIPNVAVALVGEVPPLIP